jgi:hypothetical protein
VDGSPPPDPGLPPVARIFNRETGVLSWDIVRLDDYESTSHQAGVVAWVLNRAADLVDG